MSTSSEPTAQKQQENQYFTFTEIYEFMKHRRILFCCDIDDTLAPSTSLEPPYTFPFMKAATLAPLCDMAGSFNGITVSFPTGRDAQVVQQNLFEPDVTGRLTDTQQAALREMIVIGGFGGSSCVGQENVEYLSCSREEYAAMNELISALKNQLDPNGTSYTVTSKGIPLVVMPDCDLRVIEIQGVAHKSAKNEITVDEPIALTIDLAPGLKSSEASPELKDLIATVQAIALEFHCVCDVGKDSIGIYPPSIIERQMDKPTSLIEFFERRNPGSQFADLFDAVIVMGDTSTDRTLMLAMQEKFGTENVLSIAVDDIAVFAEVAGPRINVPDAEPWRNLERLFQYMEACRYDIDTVPVDDVALPDNSFVESTLATAPIVDTTSEVHNGTGLHLS